VFSIYQNAQAQKILNESETQWVLEAQAELDRALNDPSIDENKRLEMVEHSSKVLKEYGQPPAFPDGDTPLKIRADEKFERCKQQITELSAWSLNLEYQSLDQKNKLINTIQISVAEEQIKMLIPGVTPVSLSKDVVNSVFDWNITEGFNAGQSGDAQGLVKRFKQLAETKELIERLNILIETQKDTLRKAFSEKEQMEILEEKLRQKYQYGEASTRTMNGYEGAMLYKPSNAEPAQSFKANELVGTWKFGYDRTGYFYWTFYNDGTWKFEDKMNEGEDPLTGKYSIFGNTLKLYGPKNECADVEGIFPYSIEDGDLQFKKIQDPCMSRRFTLNHIWKK
jgi:hypothetical protein